MHTPLCTLILAVFWFLINFDQRIPTSYNYWGSEHWLAMLFLSSIFWERYTHSSELNCMITEMRLTAGTQEKHVQGWHCVPWILLRTCRQASWCMPGSRGRTGTVVLNHYESDVRQDQTRARATTMMACEGILSSPIGSGQLTALFRWPAGSMRLAAHRTGSYLCSHLGRETLAQLQRTTAQQTNADSTVAWDAAGLWATTMVLT